MHVMHVKAEPVAWTRTMAWMHACIFG